MLDLVISGGYIVDGTGAAGFVGELGIDNGKIVSVKRQTGQMQGRQTIDAEDLVIAPGFIDIHTHADRNILQRPYAVNYVTQGVTTVAGGNCGSSLAPLSEKIQKRLAERYSDQQDSVQFDWTNMNGYLDQVENRKIGINFATFVGQGNLRAAVLGTEDVPADAQQIEKQQKLLRESIEQGAVGVSTGRRYPPGSYASDEEVCSLLSALSPYGLLYTSHIKNQDVDIVESINELFEAGAANDIPVQLTHLKVCGKNNWGQADMINRMMETARRQGIDVHSDVYPYTFTALSSASRLLPEEYAQMSRQEQLECLRDECRRAEVLKEFKQWGQENPVRARSIGQTGIVWAKCTDELEGLSLSEAADGADDRFSAWLDILERNQMRVYTAGIMDENDVQAFLEHDYAMVGSDGIVADPCENDELGNHPRNFGTFARVLGRYVRQKHLMTMEDAVHKMTGMPADRLQLTRRGLLREGYWADLVIFDEGEVGDKSTVDNPADGAVGFKKVLVNGTTVVSDDEAIKNALPGQVLRFDGCGVR